MMVNVSLYGELAKQHRDGRSVANFDYPLGEEATIGDLLAELGIHPEQKGFTFVNAILYDLPGLNISADEPLKDGDHIGLFSTTYMWPYQYRDGVRMSASLKEALREHGAMHHTYRHKHKNEPE